MRASSWITRLLVVDAADLIERVVEETTVDHALDAALGGDEAVLDVPVLLVAQPFQRNLAIGIHVAPLHLLIHRLVLEAGVLDADVDHLGALGPAFHGVEVVACALEIGNGEGFHLLGILSIQPLL